MLVFLFVHSYLNYRNILRASLTRAKLKKLATKQKQAIRIIDNEYYDMWEKTSGMKILNVRKINIYQVLNFMFKIKSKTAPSVFQANFIEVHHPYSVRFSEDSFVENQTVLTQKNKFAVLSRGPRLWNKLLNWQQKAVEREASFKQSIKLTLLLLENKLRFF